MNRRQSERVTKRVEVQFWQSPWQAGGELASNKILRGYSTNVSASGMHIATPTPLPAQARLRVEVLFGERGFIIEGVVAHRRAVHPELMKVNPPGMGVRFLSPEELVHELFPRGTAANRATTGDAAGGPDPGRAGAEPLPAPEAEPAEGRSFPVRFSDIKEFLGVYRRDLVKGGLFVVTSRPARLRDVIRLDLYPPGPSSPPIELAARVVQRFPPQPGRSLLAAGMGVELLELPEALARLQPIADRLADLGAR